MGVRSHFLPNVFFGLHVSFSFHEVHHLEKVGRAALVYMVTNTKQFIEVVSTAKAIDRNTFANPL